MKVIRIAIVALVGLSGSSVVAGQLYDIDYFVKSWSQQQQKEVASIIHAWLRGAPSTEVQEHTVDLVRVEALLASTRSEAANLYLPDLQSPRVAQIPGLLLRRLSEERGVPFGSDKFFAGKPYKLDMPLKHESGVVAVQALKVADGETHEDDDDAQQ